MLLNRPQFDHADLGLVDDDHTEDLRPNTRTAPVDPVLPAPAGTAQNQLNHQVEKGSSMTVPISGPEAVAQECRHCTVPTDDGTDVCAFCRTYDGPPITDSELTGPGCHGRAPSARIDGITGRVDTLRRDLNELMRGLPTDAPLFAFVDLVTGLCHLKRAAVALDRAADQLGAAEAVQR